MRDISMFVEDHAHHEFLEALLRRLSEEYKVAIDMKWYNVRRGHGKVIEELRQYIRDLGRSTSIRPDLVLVATDANCQKFASRLKDVSEITDKAPIRTVCAIPDPHIERWLLLDSAAFKQVFNRGCTAPDFKCERDRYKRQLIACIMQAGISPSLGGIEYAGDIVKKMDLERVARADKSFHRLLSELRGIFREWQR